MICSTWGFSILLSLIGILYQKGHVCDFNVSYITAIVYVIIPLIFLTIMVLCMRIFWAIKNRKFERRFRLNATTLLLISIAVACCLWIPGIVMYALYHEDQKNEGKLYGYLSLYYAHPIINAFLYGYAIKRKSKTRAFENGNIVSYITDCQISYKF